jgi:putative sterol carrier protein
VPAGPGTALGAAAEVADATTDLFESLRTRGHEPLLEQAQGTMRFELGDGRVERWTVAIDRGDVTVSRARRKADCTVRADTQLFEDIASGKVNAMAAVLRGALSVEGDPDFAASTSAKASPTWPGRNPNWMMCTDVDARATSARMRGKKLVPPTCTSADVAVLSSNESASCGRPTRGAESSRSACLASSSSRTRTPPRNAAA